MKKKVILKVLISIVMIMFFLNCFISVNATIAGINSSINSLSNNTNNIALESNDEKIEMLLKVIIVLITLILIMGVCIIKFIYDRYRLVIRFEKREDTPKKEASNAEANTDSEGQVDENVHVELNMTKLFAIMLIIVGVIIVASFM